MAFNKKAGILILAGIFFVFMLSFAIAAQNNYQIGNENKPQNVMALGNNTTNITRGQCVKETARVKNECYKAAIIVLKDCRLSAKNESIGNRTLFKQMNKDCLKANKESVKSCKASFKEARGQCKLLRKK